MSIGTPAVAFAPCANNNIMSATSSSGLAVQAKREIFKFDSSLFEKMGAKEGETTCLALDNPRYVCMGLPIPDPTPHPSHWTGP